MSTTPQGALVYSMVVASVADRQLKDSELLTIKTFAKMLPVFKGYDQTQMEQDIDQCLTYLEEDENGLETILTIIDESLPKRLRETAYVLACDVVACDGKADPEELEWLKLLRHKIGVSRLHAAALERGSYARWMRDW